MTKFLFKKWYRIEYGVVDNCQNNRKYLKCGIPNVKTTHEMSKQ